MQQFMPQQLMTKAEREHRCAFLFSCGCYPVHVGVHTVAFDCPTAIIVARACQMTLCPVTVPTVTLDWFLTQADETKWQLHSQIKDDVWESFGITKERVSEKLLCKPALSPFISDDELLLLADNMSSGYRATIVDKRADFQTKAELLTRANVSMFFLLDRRFSPQYMSVFPGAIRQSPKEYEHDEASCQIFAVTEQIPSSSLFRAKSMNRTNPNIITDRLAEIKNIICSRPFKLCEISEEKFTEVYKDVTDVIADHNIADDGGLVRMFETCDRKRKGLSDEICQCNISTQRYRHTYGIGPAHKFYLSAMSVKVVLRRRNELTAYVRIWLGKRYLRERAIITDICNFAIGKYEMIGPFTNYLKEACM